MFRDVDPKRFALFHEDFSGDTWEICTRCGGLCEINKIGSLMPGEAKYIAANLGLPTGEFRQRYLDGIETPFGVVDVLKLKPGCPFLDACFRCTIKHVKVVLCEIYPIVFRVTGDQVDFSLDFWCPIVRHEKTVASEFEKRGIAAVRALDVSVPWYRAVECYDDLCIDYDRLLKTREGELSYRVFSLAEIRASAVDVPMVDLPEYR